MADTPSAQSPPTSSETHSASFVGTDRLLELLYRELRELADRFLSQEREDHTLQPTALVHEAYLRLAGGRSVQWSDRKHFLATAARAMRRVLVDHGRTKGRRKRRTAGNQVELEGVASREPSIDSVDLVALDAALVQLGELSPRQAQVVELRFFGGLPESAIAEVLNVSERTVERDWRHAQAWLWRRLEPR